MMKRLKECIAKILAVSLMAALIICFVPQISEPVYADKGDPAMVYGSESVLKKPTYTDNAQTVWYAGNAWRVISYGGIEERSGVMALFASDILTEYGVKFGGNNDYADSNLKEVVDGLFSSLFSVEEQGAVIERELKVDEGSPSDGVSGKATTGCLWPISELEEMHCVSNKSYSIVGSGYWLRSPGRATDTDTVVVVRSDGSVERFGLDPRINVLGVRPAFWLNVESVLFTSATEGGKSSGTLGADALQPVGTNETDEWKLTLVSDSYSSFSVDEIVEKDGVYTVKYSGAKTGDNEYISAVIIDPSDNITYYGRIADASNATGSVEINTAGRFNNGDMLFVFNEQYNGDKNTDYASGLKLVATYQSGNPFTLDRPISIKDAEVVLNKTVFTYNAKVQKPTIETIDGLTLTEGTDYTAEWSDASSTNVGKYTVTITGIGKYSDTTTAAYKIKKAANPLKVKGKTAEVKYSKLKKKEQTLAVTKVINFVKKGKGEMKYTLSSAIKGDKNFKKYFKIDKTTGRLTVKTGLKTGTYKVTVKVKAAGNDNYKASAVKTVTFKVKVK